MAHLYYQKMGGRQAGDLEMREWEEVAAAMGLVQERLVERNLGVKLAEKGR